MHPGGLLAGGFVVVLVYWEAFETIVFPRRVSRRLRFTRAFYRVTWVPWRALGLLLPPGRRREAAVSVYGPLSLLLLLATWILLLIAAFAVLQWGAGSGLQAPQAMRGWRADLMLSAATLFTLSMGDVGPISTIARVLAFVEAGTGLAFLAMVIGYLPVLSQAFSRREAMVTRLDARAGSPPSAGELLVRHAELDAPTALAQLLEQWDAWAAELLETHVSFPVLAYYRSQHDNQSWAAALTMMLDVCAILIATGDSATLRPARLAFAMARHAAVDLSRIFRLGPHPPAPERMTSADLAELRRVLRMAGLPLRDGEEVDRKLARLRRAYEPYMDALSEFLLMPLPPWVSPPGARDNWQSMA